MATILPQELASIAATAWCRTGLDAEIDTWLLDDSPIMLLTGGAGMGKTVQAARTAARLNGANTWKVVTFFCSRRLTGTSVNPRSFIKIVAAQLSDEIRVELDPGDHKTIIAAPVIDVGSSSGRISGVEITLNSLSVSETFSQLIVNPLRDTKQQILIIIDGLDECLEYPGTNIADLLAENIAAMVPHARLLLTSQNNLEILDKFNSLSNKIRSIDLSAPKYRNMSKGEITFWVDTDHSDGPYTGAEIAEASDGNFFIAAALMQAPGKIGADSKLVSLNTYYLRLLDRLEAAATVADDTLWEKARLVLQLIATTSRSVTRREISALTNISPPTTESAVTAISPLLQFDQDGNGGMQFEQRDLGIFLSTEYLPGQIYNRHYVSAASAAQAFARAVLNSIDDLPADACLYLLESFGHNVILSRDDHATASEGAGDLPKWEQACSRVAAMSMTFADPTYTASTLVYATESCGFRSQERATVVGALADASSAQFRGAVVDSAVTLMSQTGDLETTIRSLLKSKDERRRALGVEMVVQSSPDDQDRACAWLATRAPKEVADQVSTELAVRHRLRNADLTTTLHRSVVPLVLKRRPRNAVRALEFLANASVTNYILHCDDYELAESTDALWRDVLVKRLGLSSSAGVAFRRLATPAALGVIARNLVRRNPLQSFTAHRAVPESEFLQVIEGLDPATDIRPFRETLQACIESDNSVEYILACMVVGVHATSEWTRASVEIDQILDTATLRGKHRTLASLSVLLPSTPVGWAPYIADRLSGISCATSKGELGSRSEDPDYLSGDTSYGFAIVKCAASAGAQETVSTLVTPNLADNAIKGLGFAGLFYPTTALRCLAEIHRVFGAQEPLADAVHKIGRVHRELVSEIAGTWTPPAHLSGFHHEMHSESRAVITTLGLYNNGVHQAINYPYMRRNILRPAFELLAASQSTSRFITRYGKALVRALVEVDYSVRGWAEHE